ncbi:MAG: TIGR04283 family arsenosugar biosynthesis glycosyltransferase [Desulfovibrionales bacterium]
MEPCETPALLSVIIPVLGENENINRCIEDVFVLGGSRATEIIIVDGDPLESTLSVITDPRVTKVSSRPGRAVQMNAGARKARGAILLFLHADTRLSLDGFSLLRETVSSGCLAGAFDLRINSTSPALRSISRITSLRARISRIPFGDQALFFSAPYFRELGGFKEIPIMEDVEIMKRIKNRGETICILPSRVYTSPRRWDQEGIFFCTIRNWCLRLLFAAGVSPARLAKMYRPHRSRHAGS